MAIHVLQTHGKPLRPKESPGPWVKPLSPERVRKAALDAVVRLGGGYQQEN